MSKTGAYVWLAVVILCTAFVLSRFASGFPLETNILALLPEQTETVWVREAKTRIAEKVAKRVVIAVAHQDYLKARNSLQNLLNELEADGLILGKESAAEGKIEALGAVLFPYRTGLLSDADRALLEKGQGDQIANMALAQIMSPFAMADGDMIAQDPFLIFSRYLTSLSRVSPKMERKDGLLTALVDGQYHVLATAKLTGEPFSQAFQAKFVPRFVALEQAAIKNNAGLAILKTGAIFYADQSIRTGQQEATYIGAVSLTGIVLVLLLVFRSSQPIFLCLVAVGAGLAGGMAATLIVFDRVHLMALVFGAGLIGISVDYAIHYCCERFSERESSANDRLRIVFPGLTLGMTSSVIGFLTLALAPFPGLQQIAVLSAFGLAASYATVVLFFPIVDKATGQVSGTPLVDFAACGRHIWAGLPSKTVNWGMALVIVIGAASSLVLIEPDDDVRKLQSLPVSLKTQETELRKLSGFDNAAQFFLVSGKTTEDVLQAEEKLIAELDLLVARDALVGYNAMAKVVPSRKRQADNRAVLEEYLLAPHLSGFLKSIRGNADFGYGDAKAEFLTPQAFAKRGGAAFLDLLTLQDSRDGVVHIVTLSGVKNLSSLNRISQNHENVRLIDQGQEWSAVLATYRVRALTLLAAAIGLIWVFLSFRYRPAFAAKVVFVPLAAVVLTPLIVAGVGGVFTFFNAMALILVFVIGLDYALFSAEVPQDHKNISFFANGLSALSTILAFGLMSFSQLYAVHAFGATIFIGIALAFALSPLAEGRS